MSRAVIVGLLALVHGLAACGGQPGRRPGPGPELAAEVRNVTGCAHRIATAEGFVVSASSQTQLERELPGESFYSKELLWLNASRDGDSVRINAHVQNTRDGARRTQPSSLSPTAQRVIARIQSDCVIAVARPE